MCCNNGWGGNCLWIIIHRCKNIDISTFYQLVLAVLLANHMQSAPGLLRGLVCFDISSDKLLDLRGRRCPVGFAGSLVGFQHIGLQVQREADVVLAQIFDLRFVF